MRFPTRLSTGRNGIVLALLVLALAGLSRAGTRDYSPFPNADAGYVTDLAGLLTPAQQQQLARWLLHVDYCPRCKGIWFDGDELEQALPVADPQLRVPRDAVPLQTTCPRCAQHLYAFVYPRTRVTIEMCKACRGLWLDAGEFKQLRQAREQLPPAEEPTPDTEVGGLKGALLRFIDAALEQLLY